MKLTICNLDAKANAQKIDIGSIQPYVSITIETEDRGEVIINVDQRFIDELQELLNY